jgi:GNAT superfamily N-acetyltransferase
MPTPDIRLLPLDRPTLHALRDAPDAVAREHAILFGEYERLVQDVAAQTAELGDVADADAPWGGYLAVDRATRAIVGTCAFKAPPTGDGAVEIAYFTFPAHERHGYARAMAAALLAIAEASRRPYAACSPTPCPRRTRRRASSRRSASSGWARWTTPTTARSGGGSGRRPGSRVQERRVHPAHRTAAPPVQRRPCPSSRRTTSSA